MTRGYEPIVWVPVAVTVGLWLVVVGLAASFVSTTWADLVGLLALPVAPVAYRSLVDVVGDGTAGAGEETPGSSSGGIRAR